LVGWEKANKENCDLRLAALQNLETLTLTNNLYNVYQADALEDMKTIPDKSVDLLLTDPLYGISIDEVAMSIGHKSGGLPTTGFNYKDSKEDALLHYSVLAKESFRFCTEASHAFVFTSPTNFCALRDLFREAGWLCSDRPIIWIKNETGQNNNPDKWFSSTYEILLFARRQSSRLVVEAKGDWIQTPPVWGEQKMHQAQKPLVLLKELIQRTTLPGQSLYDPFMGSGSSIIAALEMKIFARGCDIAEESFATTMYRIREWETMQKVK
jgi:site-specific DNA-methyltransferase (adenine-specific)